MGFILDMTYMTYDLIERWDSSDVFCNFVQTFYTIFWQRKPVLFMALGNVVLCFLFLHNLLACLPLWQVLSSACSSRAK